MRPEPDADPPLPAQPLHTTTMTRRQALLAAGVASSGLFLWLALRTIDAAELGLALRRMNLWLAFPFLACLVGFCWLKAARWAILLEPVSPSTARALLPSVVIGYAGTTLMPMQLGEVARAYVASRMLNARMAAVLTSIALERILDVFVVLCVFGVVLLLGAEVGSTLREAGVWMTAFGIAALAGLTLFAIWPDRCVRLVHNLSQPLPDGMRQFVQDQLQAASTGLAILRRPSRFAALLVASATQWLFMLGCCWIALLALGTPLPTVAALLVLVTTLFGMSLPSGPGYLGTIQLAFWLALAGFGVPREDAIAASIFYHALLCGPLLLWGAVELLRTGLRVSDLQKVAGDKR